MTTVLPVPSESAMRDYHTWHEQRVRTCLDHLRGFVTRSGLRCLDLGHDPKMGPLLEDLGMRVTGNVYPGSPIPAVPWTLAPFDLEEGFSFPAESFDVVTAFEVIEHVVSSPRRLLREALRVLKPGGLLYIGTPNVCAWAKVRRMFAQVHPYDASAYSADFSERHPMCHVYEYDPWTLKELVRSEGFIVQDCATWNPYPSDPRDMRDAVLRLLVSASLLVTGHVKDAAQLWRLRGHQIGLLARKPL
jgi:SAM-dependent methyltransferase